MNAPEISTETICLFVFLAHPTYLCVLLHRHDRVLLLSNEALIIAYLKGL